jgi:hypothetical protein
VTQPDDSTAFDLDVIPPAEENEDEFIRRMGEEAERKPPKRRGRPSNADKEREFKEANKPLDPEKAAEAQRLKELEKWREPCPVDSFQETWHWALAHIHEQGWGPEQIQIVVIRLTPVPGQSNPQPLHLNPRIRGDQVLGDPDNGYPAGEALLWFVIDYFHKHPGVYGTYKLQFLGPDREHIAITKPFPLERWADLDKRRGDIDRATTEAAAQSTAGYTPRRPWPPGVSAVAADAGFTLSEFVELREKLARLEVEAQRPQVAAAPPPSAQAVEYEKKLYEMKLEMEKQRAANEMALMEARFNAKLEAALKPQAAPVEDIGAAMVKMLMTLGLLGPDGKPVGAAAQPIAPTASPAEQLKEAAKIVIDQRKSADAAEQSLRTILGVPEPATEIIEREEPKEENWFVKQGKALFEGVMKNPEVALGVVGGLVGEASPAGQFVTATAKTITAAKAAARTATSVPMGGAQGGGYKPPAA